MIAKLEDRLPTGVVPILTELGLRDKTLAALSWCEKAGVNTLADLGEGYDKQDFVVEFADALEPLPPIKKGKLVNTLRREIATLKNKREL